MYQDTDFPPPKVFEEDFSQLDYNNHQKKFYDKMQTVNPQKTRRYYYAMVSMIDECLGRLLDTLEKLKLLENTIIIFTSDHGEMLGDHARYAKGCLYEEAVKIPLVIMNKDLVKPGITSPELVESIDLFPTILDYADIKPVNIEYNCRGKSLQGLLEGNDRTHKDAVFSQLADWMMIRTKEWKLSYGYTDGNPYFPAPESNKGVLFDLVRDPDERFNRYDEAGYKDVTCKLLQRLLDFFVNEKIPLHKQIPAIAFENMDEPNIMHLL